MTDISYRCILILSNVCSVFYKNFAIILIFFK
nr:MAG TPA: hypothetical protein [Caudoviricetes sp.]